VIAQARQVLPALVRSPLFTLVAVVICKVERSSVVQSAAGPFT
jgi:hypothetical protein